MYQSCAEFMNLLSEYRGSILHRVAFTRSLCSSGGSVPHQKWGSGTPLMTRTPLKGLYHEMNDFLKAYSKFLLAPLNYLLNLIG